MHFSKHTEAYRTCLGICTQMCNKGYFKSGKHVNLYFFRSDSLYFEYMKLHSAKIHQM